MRGIPARLVDFPEVDKSAEAVVRWVEQYFTSPAVPSVGTAVRVPKIVKTTVAEALKGASPIVVTDRMPIILQHQGHSRTIVGIEKTRKGDTNLLMFDPAK